MRFKFNFETFQHNGMRAICPATVSMLINLISKWHCDAKLRKTSLQCYALMAIVLQRSSPVEVCLRLQTKKEFFLIKNILSAKLI